MASVFRKTATRPLPDRAEIFTRKGDRFARWKDRHGKTRTAPLTIGRDGSDRIVTTVESAAELIHSLPLPEEAEVIVLGNTAYDAKVVRNACQERNYPWIFPLNPERVYDGLKGARPQVRSRLKDWTSLSLKTIRLRASIGKYADYRRLSRWHVGHRRSTGALHLHLLASSPMQIVYAPCPATYGSVSS